MDLSNSQKTPCQNLRRFSRSLEMYSDILGVQENRKEFSNGVFCILLPGPFDKLDMTRGRGQWEMDKIWSPLLWPGGRYDKWYGIGQVVWPPYWSGCRFYDPLSEGVWILLPNPLSEGGWILYSQPPRESISPTLWWQVIVKIPWE